MAGADSWTPWRNAAIKYLAYFHRVTKKPGPKAKLPFSEYLLKNFYITTSGNFRLTPLLNAILEVGSDRIMFSSDYPFEQVTLAANLKEGVQKVYHSLDTFFLCQFGLAVVHQKIKIFLLKTIIQDDIVKATHPITR